MEYRSLRCVICNVFDYQLNAVVSLTGSKKSHTLVYEHKHFEFGNQDNTVIKKEFLIPYQKG